MKNKADGLWPYRVGVELDGGGVFAAADAAISLHLAAEEFPSPVELCISPEAFRFCTTRERTVTEQSNNIHYHLESSLAHYSIQLRSLIDNKYENRYKKVLILWFKVGFS